MNLCHLRFGFWIYWTGLQRIVHAGSDISKLQIPHSKFQISNLKSQISNLKSQISNGRLLIPNSGFKDQASK